MGNTVQFVDAISSSPTVRLNVNDESTWACRRFDAPPPRLRRSVSSNAMRDGVHVSSSLYDARPITMELELRTATQDLNATQIQTLARELDREDNILKYQPTGATKPVFFKLYRSDMSAITDVNAATAMRVIQVELLAEPFALGLKEALGPFTVSNNPAAGSNGAFVDVSGVIGDVPSPALIQNTSRWAVSGIICSRQHGTPSDLVFFKQAESCTLRTDTTNPGGGPDAAMSGTGVNNFVRTSFATDSDLISRVTWNLSGDINTLAEQVAARGEYRVVAAVRRNGTTSTLTAALSIAGISGPVRTLPEITSRMLLDLGLFTMSGAPRRLPNQTTDIGVSLIDTIIAADLDLQAGRSGGSDTLDWDCIFLLPADEQFMIWNRPVVVDDSSTSGDQVIDAYQESIYAIVGADPFASTTLVEAARCFFPLVVTGGYPTLVPDQTNRLFVQTGTRDAVTPVGDTNALTFHYWPRYLYVRPSAS